MARNRPQKSNGTLYFNTILRSVNSGGSFSIELNLPSTDDGIFLTPLGSSDANPDEIYTASRLGFIGTQTSGDLDINPNQQQLGYLAWLLGQSFRTQSRSSLGRVWHRIFQ